MLDYERKMPVKDAVLKDKLEQVARENTSWGYRVVAGHLAILGEPVGISRAQRVWKNSGLSRSLWKKRRKIRTGARLNPSPDAANSVWCLDFAEDRLENQSRFNALLVKDEATAYCFTASISRSFKGVDVRKILSELVEQYGKPRNIRSDNGGQFISYAVKQWATDNHIEMAYIDPGKPWQNGSAESLIGTYRREILDAELFYNLEEARIISERWRRRYNQVRPHSRHKGLPPEQVWNEMKPKVA
jgi:putative transposase